MYMALAIYIYITSIHGCQRLNPTVFVDPLTFPLLTNNEFGGFLTFTLPPKAGQSFHVFTEISQFQKLAHLWFPCNVF